MQCHLFGELLPLWQHFKNIWQLFEGLISIWQTFEPTLENSVYFWANLHSCKWSNIEQTFKASGQTANMSILFSSTRGRGLPQRHVYLSGLGPGDGAHEVADLHFPLPVF